VSRKLGGRPIEALISLGEYLEPYFEVIGIAIQSHPEIPALVWSALRLILKVYIPTPTSLLVFVFRRE
jgi:hypothetical protein